MKAFFAFLVHLAYDLEGLAAGAGYILKYSLYHISPVRARKIPPLKETSVLILSKNDGL
jgi:hypothetical protein